MIKKIASISGNFILALGVAIGVKYLIELISPCEQVTSSHLAVMTTSVFWMIRKYPLSGIWKAKKSEL
jgi:hypothetical protein